VTDETREACRAMFERHLADARAAHLLYAAVGMADSGKQFTKLLG
jgi:hypothetical protein